jgi:antitoxin component of MazEF toxin-antitoxin module
MNIITDQTTKVFKNGNSRAIRLPKSTFTSAQPGDTLIVSYQDDKIILQKPQKQPREGWAELFEKAAANDPDNGIIIDKYGALDPDWAISDGLSEYAGEYDAK